MKKNDIINRLKSELDRKRFEHTLGVAYTAASLAMRYDMDIEQAFMAGLLHDCAKNLTHQERLNYCKKHNIPIKQVEEDNPSLLHAKVGSYLAQEIYEIKDSAIHDAIFYHTTGRPEMSPLEEIIFVADYIEPLRNHEDELPDIRREAFIDIQTAIKHIYHNTVEYLNSVNKPIDQTTYKAYEYYCKKEDNYG